MDDISEYSVSNARQHQQQRQSEPVVHKQRTVSGNNAATAATAYNYDQLRDADLFAVAPGSSTLHQQQASGLLQSSASAQTFRASAPPALIPVSQSSIPSSSTTADGDLTDLDLSEHQRKAINNWGWRVKICFALHMIGALCLLHSYYWFTTVIGIVLLIGIWLYAYSIKQQQTNFVLLYVIMVLVNLVKNILILYFYFENYKNGSTFTSYEYFLIIFMLCDCALLTPTMTGHGHGHGGNESPVVKFLISGTVAWTFELIIGHYLEFLKISKQTSELSYAQLTRNMIQHKGLIGVLDGYFPWGSIQCFVKGASFGFGQTLGYNLLKGKLPDFQAEVASGGVGGLVQGVVMSPLLLLKTRVMTMPEMRNSGGVIATTIASTKMGAVVIRKEGPMALMKGSVLFSTKRMADWTTRFFFAEVVADSIRKHNANKGEKRALTFNESSVAALLGGALSATATIPMDVLVATFQSSAKAGQKVSVMEVWKEKMAHGGVMGVIKYSSKGYVARVAHVAATTLLMKSVSTAVYELYDKVKQKK